MGNGGFLQRVRWLADAEHDGGNAQASRRVPRHTMLLVSHLRPRPGRPPQDHAANDRPSGGGCHQTDDLPGIPQTLAFTDIDGRQIELFSRWQFAPPGEQVRGIVVSKLGHMALYAPDPDRTAKFYSDVLGFRDSDRIEENFVFMRCGFEHHSINFARGADGRLHHIAFELRDAAHMHQACDLLGRRKIALLWGPVRHGPGHNVAIYHRNPDGYLVELFFDLDRMVDEELGYFEPRPWHRDRPQRPKTWIGLPRDVWGVGPAPEATEFSPKMRGSEP